jgi:hypothetical protein
VLSRSYRLDFVVIVQAVRSMSFHLSFAVIANAVLFGSRSFYLSMYFVIVDLYLLFDLIVALYFHLYVVVFVVVPVLVLVVVSHPIVLIYQLDLFSSLWSIALYFLV